MESTVPHAYAMHTNNPLNHEQLARLISNVGDMCLTSTLPLSVLPNPHTPREALSLMTSNTSSLLGWNYQFSPVLLLNAPCVLSDISSLSLRSTVQIWSCEQISILPSPYPQMPASSYPLKRQIYLYQNNVVLMKDFHSFSVI